MKLELNIAEEIEIAVQRKQQKEYKLLGSYIPKIDGYNIFEYNKATKEIQKATFEENTTYVIGGSNNSKLHINPNCIYVEALNLKNAIKRLKRGDIIHES